MSFLALCNHRGVIHRPPGPDEAPRDELQDVQETFTALPAPPGLNCRPNQNWSGVLQDHGPGEQQAAHRQWFLVAEFDARERDVLEVTEGPEAPLLLRIVSVSKPAAPLVTHHLEVNVEIWAGPLDREAAVSS